MQTQLYLYGFCTVLGVLPAMSFADNAWGNYRSVERPNYSRSAPPAYQTDPFAFSNQRYTPTAPPQGYYYQPNQNHDYAYSRQRPRIRIEYYPETQYERSYRRESFVIGSALPSEFRSERYVIRDWRDYDLYTPPSGRHWVVIDGRYFLVTDDRFMIEIVR